MSEVASSNGKTYKFQTNLHATALDRTRYMSFLKRLTSNPEVSNRRLIIGMAIFGLLTAGLIVTLFQLGSLLKYIFPGVFGLYFVGVVLVLLYLIPSRGESMLMTVLNLNISRIYDRIRLRTSANGEIRTLGIYGVSRDGMMKFETTDEYGYIYEVEGQFSPSTLPAVADRINGVRYNHLLGRSATSSEQLILSISRVDLTEQLEYFRSIHHANDDSKNPDHLIRRYLAKMDYDHTKNNVHLKNPDIRQLIIVKDMDKNELRKSAQQFENSVGQGMLAYAERIDSRRGVLKALSGIGLVDPEDV